MTRVATQRAVSDLVVDLPEPYRTALLLRYFEDLGPYVDLFTAWNPVDVSVRVSGYDWVDLVGVTGARGVELTSGSPVEALLSDDCKLPSAPHRLEVRLRRIGAHRVTRIHLRDPDAEEPYGWGAFDSAAEIRDQRILLGAPGQGEFELLFVLFEDGGPYGGGSIRPYRPATRYHNNVAIPTDGRPVVLGDCRPSEDYDEDLADLN